MPGRISPASFRDPSGFVFERDGVLYRFVARSYAPDYDLLIGSGLHARLVDDGLLVPHDEVALAGGFRDAYRIIRPERLSFVSYPYEWCFGEFRDAALATLDGQRVAMEFGMSLRDASAFNVQFRDGRPVLIDTLSFGRLEEGRPWVAYRQFCRHFLAPLALMSAIDARMGLFSRPYIDGVPLDLTSRLLPRRSRLRPGLAVHIHAHARAERRSRKTRRGTSGALTRRALLGLVESLSSTIRSLPDPRSDSPWTSYYDEDSYSEVALAHKSELVGRFLERARPASVWDLGANTGAMARLAAGRGIDVIAFDSDVGCVEHMYRQARSKGETHLLPLVLDLSNPTPAIGWNNRERESLTSRGPADLVMALALIHHLAIGNNTPLEMIAEYLAGLSRRLAVEFVPKSDPKVKLLLGNREDIFGAYTREGFEHAFRAFFDVEERETIRDSERVLYLMRRREG